MKEFMLIFIGGADPSALSPEDMQNQMMKWFAWVEKLKKENIYSSGEALMPGGKHLKGAKHVITDGPFAESKEVVGGYFIVKANTLEEAIEIAKECPDLPYNSTIEVREVMKFN